MRALITGISGFAGRHLAALLSGRGYEVFGTVRRPESRARLRDWLAAEASPDSSLPVADVLDAGAIAAVVAAVRPQQVFHLAGSAQIGGSYAHPAEVFAANALGTVNVLAAVRDHAPACRVISVGSGDAYGIAQRAGEAITEQCPFQPVSPYGASKAAADLAAYQWAHGSGLDVVRVRPFNHIGPGQQLGFVCPDFAQQLVAIERGRQPPAVTVGNLDAVRDFTDVRDAVAAYVAAADAGERGEAYNVCSGVGRSIRRLLEDMIGLCGLRVEIRIAADRLRASDVAVLVGSAEKLRTASGWRPTHGWQQTLADVLEDWRRRA
jgi:GDP-4-dehydro-6-deoxy-D-mannose reductase